MTRTNKSKPNGGEGTAAAKPNNSHHRSQAREIAISKALSRLLRHRAIDEGISIDSRGYVRLDHLLSWRRLRSIYPGGEAVSFEEIVDVVLRNEKQRFALKFENEGEDREVVTVKEGENRETETEKAISKFEAGQRDTRNYFIRANQGHSISEISEEGLLVPITHETSLPETIVHGTFYGSWAQILNEGGLKKMRRNHVHFATGPALSEVLSPSMLSGLNNNTNNMNVIDGGMQSTEKGGSTLQVKKVLNENKVISGMRFDAQILIYIDVRRALCPLPPDLSDSSEPPLKFWKSENGVILTTGSGVEGLVSMDYWICAVEVREGIGLLWTHGEGIVKELPDRLKTRPIPHGKGKGPGFTTGGGGSDGTRGKSKAKGNDKPKVVVERGIEDGL